VKLNKYILTIDLGNTNDSCCLFDQQKVLLKKFNLNNWPIELQAQDCFIIYSSVREHDPKIVESALDAKDFLKDNFYFDMPIHYSVSLGCDRLVNAYGVFHDQMKPTIIIDSGTFTTIDFVTHEGFCGGYILPGLDLIQNSYRRGQKLRTPESVTNSFLPIPQSTQDAITKGTTLAFVSPILELLRQFQWDNIFLTGGNGKLIEFHLNNNPLCQAASIQTEPNLIHYSLLKIATKVNL
jgi:type III pantothenate kinase